MAGGNPYLKIPQKGKNISAFDSAEIYKNLSPKTNDVSSILSGVLTPGETIEFNREIKITEKTKFVDYIQTEQAIFVNTHEEQTAKSIQELKNQIQSLVPITEDLTSDIANVTMQNIPETNAYQLNFLERIKNFIVEVRQNIDQAGAWLESFNHKKAKRNAFWNKAKSGGQKYLESSEHGVARSAN